MTKLEIELGEAILNNQGHYAKAAAEVAKRYIEKALTHGYHAAKDEEKGIRSQGYGTRFMIENGVTEHPGIVVSNGTTSTE